MAEEPEAVVLPGPPDDQAVAKIRADAELALWRWLAEAPKLLADDGHPMVWPDGRPVAVDVLEVVRAYEDARPAAGIEIPPATESVPGHLVVALPLAPDGKIEVSALEPLLRAALESSRTWLDSNRLERVVAAVLPAVQHWLAPAGGSGR